MTTATEGQFNQNPSSLVSGQRSVAGLTSKGSERASLAKIGKNSWSRRSTSSMSVMCHSVKSKRDSNSRQGSFED